MIPIVMPDARCFRPALSCRVSFVYVHRSPGGREVENAFRGG
jgi:hypothetical protein